MKMRCLVLVLLLNGLAAADSVITLDQSNTAFWNRAWTNLVNDVRQAFVPGLPILSAV